MRKRRSLAGIAALAVAVVLGAVSDVAAGRASRTRSGGGSAGGGKVASGSRSGGAPKVASGRATYGHHRGGGRYGHYGSYGHYGYYGPYGYYGYGPYYYGYGYPGYWYWGWPVVYQVQTSYAVPTGVPARLETDVRPKKARVFLDGVEVGQARDYNGNWDVLEVRPGKRVIELRAEGYMTLRLAVDTRAGATYRISERLEPGEGLDPRSADPEPEPPAPAKPAPAAVDRDASELSASPPPDRGLQRGLLRMRISPPDAAVYLDGEFLARADELARLHGAIPVAAGIHVVEVVRPGFEGQTHDIEVAGDRPVELTVSLLRNGG